MIEIYRRSFKLFAWSLYGFALVFALFVAQAESSEFVQTTQPYSDISGHYSANVGGSIQNKIGDLAGNRAYYCYRTVRHTRSEGVYIGGGQVTYTMVQDTTSRQGTHYQDCWNPASSVNQGHAPYTEAFTGTCTAVAGKTYCLQPHPSNVTHRSENTIVYFGATPLSDSDTGEECDSGVTFNSASNYSCAQAVCQQGEMSASCSVDCPATEWYSSGSVGHGQSCGSFQGGGNLSFTDTPIADYACVGSGGLSKCDTGLNNGQTGSGAGGSHTIDDTFYEYCKGNASDTECIMTFGVADLPTCQNGAAFDPLLGCDYEIAEDVICPDGQQQNANTACVDRLVVAVPIVAPSAEFVGGIITGGVGVGDSDGEVGSDSSAIVAAINKTTDAVRDGNTIASSQLESLQSIEECLTGECGDLSLPSVLDNDLSTSQTAFSEFQSRVSSAPIVSALGNIVNVGNFGNGGTCPVFDLVLFGVPISTILHCDLWNTVAPIISTFMMVYWTLLAYRKFTDNF